MDKIKNNIGVPQQVNSVLHAIKIMELFAASQREYMSLTEISRELEMHKTTVYRILRTLQSVGWIQQRAVNGQYRLGSGILFASSAAALYRMDRDLITEEMEQLAEQFNEMVILADVQDNSGICVDLIKSRYNLSMITAIGYVVPLGSGATGKMLLAVQPDEFIARITARLRPDERRTFSDQMAKIKEQRYCYTENEVDQGAAALAVPLLTDEKRYVISISGPVERMRNIGVSVLRTALWAAVDRIEQKTKGLAVQKKR